MDHVTSRFADSLRGTRGRKRDEERERGERRERREGERETSSRVQHTYARTHTRTRGGTCVTYNRVRVYLGKSVCGHVPVRVG